MGNDVFFMREDKAMLAKKWITGLAAVTVLVSLALAPQGAKAGWIVPPVGPGEDYHLAFVTSETTQATETSIDYYNDFVNAAAANDGMGEVVWSCIGSTSVVDARDNALVSAPVYRLDGTPIAGGFADMWDGTLSVPLNRTEFGDELDGLVWTGTDPDGYGNVSRYLGSSVYQGNTICFGKTEQSDLGWINDGFVVSSNEYHLYALSPALTNCSPIPVPEPSTLAIWSLLGLTGAGVVGWRRKRR